jgi:hypothetical protein
MRAAIYAALLLSCSTALAQAQSPFLRLQKPTKTVEVLQTKARKYASPTGKGPDIWLVGVAHIGQADYYKQLQKLLDQQGLVFYEGVTRKGVDPAAPKETGKEDPRQNSTYKMLSDTLGLEFQLIAIDYKRPTFKNSDLSWEEMSALEAKAPKSGTGPSLSTIGNLLNPDSPQAKMLGSFLAGIKNDPSSIEAMRLVMVETLSMPNAVDKAMSPALSDLIIKTRNAKVLADLKSELATGSKSVAIFFGAGHMGDMESHLIKDFGYKPGEERWFSAIKGDTSKVKPGQGQMILDMMRAQLKAKG